jgi:hypothetical protein
VLATPKQAFAVAPRVSDLRIVVLRSTQADTYGNVRAEAIVAARIARAALSGVQWTTADALTILNEIGRTPHSHSRLKRGVCGTRSESGA